MNIDQIVSDTVGFRERLSEVKDSEAINDFTWYGYDILANVEFMNRLISEEERENLSALGQCRVADIGGADGDLAFLFEQHGHDVDLVDWPATNWNGLRGARELKRRLGSNISIHEIDLDSQFNLPRDRYEVVLFLGILYHVKNPFYILERLAKTSNYCILSTRVAGFAGKPEINIESVPVAYLLDPDECSNDPTNYWIFSRVGLERLARRSGWDIKSSFFVGASHSNPYDQNADERAFVFMKSRYV